ncbi:hypothetical protein [Aeromonas allosaccharophila]|uniref:hypothetical protein n=1 Tax=Aeromonas allosaccharophila TaxID=656 RepID=UPI003985FFFA
MQAPVFYGNLPPPFDLPLPGRKDKITKVAFHGQIWWLIQTFCDEQYFYIAKKLLNSIFTLESWHLLGIVVAIRNESGTFVNI